MPISTDIVVVVAILAVALILWGTLEMFGFGRSQKTANKIGVGQKNPKPKKVRVRKTRMKAWFAQAIKIVRSLCVSIFKLSKKLYAHRSVLKRIRPWLPTLGIVLFLAGLVFFVWKVIIPQQTPTESPEGNTIPSWVLLVPIALVAVFILYKLYKKVREMELRDKLPKFKVRQPNKDFLANMLWLCLCLTALNAIIWKWDQDGYDEIAGSWFYGLQLAGLLLLAMGFSLSSKKKFYLFRTPFLTAALLMFTIWMVTDESVLNTRTVSGVGSSTVSTKTRTPEIRTTGKAFVSWWFPPGMDNLQYPGENLRTEKDSKAEVVRNDSEVFEIKVFDKYSPSSVLRYYRWDRNLDKEYGRFTVYGNIVGRKADNGEWYLKSTETPGVYRGAWRSIESSNEKWIDMELDMR